MISAERFAELKRQHPDLALNIYHNFGRELAIRLHVTAKALRALE
jgi:hypothetical protein